MALRVLLLGLVASMGLELPTGQDLASWTRSGRDWADSRMADLSGLRQRAEVALAAAIEVAPEAVEAPTPEAASGRADLAFVAVVEGMASAFAADLALMEDASPAEEAVMVAERFREMPPAESSDAQAGGDSVEAPDQPPIVARGPEAPSRAERLSAAVRLTRQALNAWASLVQPATVKVADDGLGHSF